jgi:hypothetical protein
MQFFRVLSWSLICCLTRVWVSSSGLVLPCRTSGGASSPSTHHKVHIHLEYHSVCPLVGIGTPSTPSPTASVYPPPLNQRRGTHSPVGEGVGQSQFGRLEKSLTLCLLCGLHTNRVLPSFPFFKIIGLRLKTQTVATAVKCHQIIQLDAKMFLKSSLQKGLKSRMLITF